MRVKILSVLGRTHAGKKVTKSYRKDRKNHFFRLRLQQGSKAYVKYDKGQLWPVSSLVSLYPAQYSSQPHTMRIPEKEKEEEEEEG